MILPVPLDYLAGLLIWTAIVVGALVWLLRARRTNKGRSGRLRWINFGLSVWFGVALLTVGEYAFAFFVDRSDAFNATNISRRWTELHIDRERNELGFRDRNQFEKTPPERTRRICFVGDSFTMGHGVVDMSNRFSDRVAADLNRSQPGKFTVANIADLGLEVAQIEGRVKKLFDDGYKMDVVVYVICLNDIEYYADALNNQNSKTGGTSTQPSKPFFLCSKTYFLNWLYFRFKQVAQPQVRGYYDRLKDAYDSEAWEPFRRHLDRLDATCRAHHAELRVAIFPFLHNLGSDYPFVGAHHKIDEYCREKEMPVLDLEPVFREHAGERLTVNAFDAHPNEGAHAIAAEAISNSLLNDLK
jgi:hypothetical protein